MYYYRRSQPNSGYYGNRAGCPRGGAPAAPAFAGGVFVIPLKGLNWDQVIAQAEWSLLDKDFGKKDNPGVPTGGPQSIPYTGDVTTSEGPTVDCHSLGMCCTTESDLDKRALCCQTYFSQCIGSKFGPSRR